MAGTQFVFPAIVCAIVTEPGKNSFRVWQCPAFCILIKSEKC